MKQKLLLFLLVILMTLPAVAQEFEYQGLNYSILDDNTVGVVRNEDAKGDIVIPAMVVYNHKQYSVTSIGRDAFSNCSGLLSVIIPSSVTSVGENAFNGCKSLKKCAYPNTINNPFPSNHLGEHYFSYPAEGAVIEDGYVWGPDKTALYFAPLSLEGDCILPNSVTTISRYAFFMCSQLTSVDIPNSLKTIEEGAFRNCNGLKSIVIPKAVTSIGVGAFQDCDNIEHIEFNAENCTSCGSPEHPAFSSRITSFLFGNDVKIIPAYLLYCCGNINSLKIPESVTSIGRDAFYGCSGLTSVVIPNSVTSIGSYAFMGCSGLTSVDISNSVTSIGNGTFSGCSGLTSVVIPNSVISIGGMAFFRCKSLISIGIPNSVTLIGPAAFGGCSEIQTIYSANEVPPTCMSDTFDNVPVEAVVYVPFGSIPKYAESEGWKRFFNFKGSDNFPSAVESNSVDAGSDSKNIFNMNGVCVKRNATQADVDALAPGLYIIAGKKVVVK